MQHTPLGFSLYELIRRKEMTSLLQDIMLHETFDEKFLIQYPINEMCYRILLSCS
jgi:hypothetical protein